MSTVSDLDTWRLFFKIVSRGSIAKVSEEIGVEASSISRRINKLEKDLGVELFRRKGKSAHKCRICGLFPHETYRF